MSLPLLQWGQQQQVDKWPDTCLLLSDPLTPATRLPPATCSLHRLTPCLRPQYLALVTCPPPASCPTCTCTPLPLTLSHSSSSSPVQATELMVALALAQLGSSGCSSSDPDTNPRARTGTGTRSEPDKSRGQGCCCCLAWWELAFACQLPVHIILQQHGNYCH